MCKLPHGTARALRHETENALVWWFMFHDHVSRARGPVADRRTWFQSLKKSRATSNLILPNTCELCLGIYEWGRTDEPSTVVRPINTHACYPRYIIHNTGDEISLNTHAP